MATHSFPTVSSVGMCLFFSFLILTNPSFSNWLILYCTLLLKESWSRFSFESLASFFARSEIESAVPTLSRKCRSVFSKSWRSELGIVGNSMWRPLSLKEESEKEEKRAVLERLSELEEKGVLDKLEQLNV